VGIKNILTMEDQLECTYFPQHQDIIHRLAKMDKQTTKEIKRLHEIIGDMKMEDYVNCDACGRKCHPETIIQKKGCKVCRKCNRFVRGGFKK